MYRALASFVLVRSFCAVGDEAFSDEHLNDDDDACFQGHCALKALQLAASKSSHEAVLNEEGPNAVEVSGTPEGVNTTMINGIEVEVEDELAPSDDSHDLGGGLGEDACPTDTGGTCNLWSCSSSRNATCVSGNRRRSSRCMCAQGFCAVGGACEPAGSVMMDKMKDWFQKMQPPPCEKDTGGTCKLFGCGASRNSSCVSGQRRRSYRCLCPDGFCAKDGKCERAPNPMEQMMNMWTKMIPGGAMPGMMPGR